jgi:hypothetical protein
MTALAPALAVINSLVDQPAPVIASLCDSDQTWGAYIFRDGLPLRLVGTGKRALVLSSSPGAAPTAHAYGSTVTVRIYADHTRDVSGVAAVEDGLDRAWAAYGVLDQLLHSPAPLTIDPLVQCDHATSPLESFDADQDLPYLAVNYDIAILASV